jgi:hypothetical protein
MDSGPPRWRGNVASDDPEFEKKAADDHRVVPQTAGARRCRSR